MIATQASKPLQTVKTIYTLVCATRVALLAAASLSASFFASAQTAPAGTIEGRVTSGRSGEYLENARITVEGTDISAKTDAQGRFQLTVPPGRITLRVAFDGFRSAERQVTAEVLQIKRAGPLILCRRCLRIA